MIAGQLGKAVSTVSREVKANGGRGDYRAWQGQERAAACAKRPKTLKLSCPRPVSYTHLTSATTCPGGMASEHSRSAQVLP